MEPKRITGSEVAKHATKDSCWLVIHGNVWDLTKFVDDHPGGSGIILACSGKDATRLYAEIHDQDLIKDTLSSEACLGVISDPLNVEQASLDTESASHHQIGFPRLNTIISVDDFEHVAKSYLSPAGWAYYSSAADDSHCVADTRRLFRRIVTRPRVLRPVEPVSTKTGIIRCESSLPVYFSPTGQGKYANPDSDSIIAEVAGKEGLIYCMPTGSPYEKVFQARHHPSQKLFFQLYTGRDKRRTQALIRRMEGLGAAAVFLTVDSPVLSKRERDDRVRAALGDDTVATDAGGIAKSSSLSMLNPLLSWEDLSWIRKTTSLPLVLKGIQTVEDAVQAYAHGVAGIVLSNHGGRSQDTAQAPILTLLEIRRHAPQLLAPATRDTFQIFLDGGIRRGTDVLKALALGATAVGIGRPVLYSMCADYGAQGLHRLCRILRSEIATNMALLGASKVDDIVPEMINAERAVREVSRAIKL